MVVYGFGSVIGGPILGYVNDKLGGEKTVSKVSILLHFVIYGSLIFCNEVRVFGFLCFLSGFCTGAADSSQMTQISIMIAKNFSDKSSQVFALFNIVKMPVMSLIMLSFTLLNNQSDFRIFFILVLIQCVLGQLLLLFFFPFRTDLES